MDPTHLDASPRGDPRGFVAVLEALTDTAIDGAQYDADLPARQRVTPY